MSQQIESPAKGKVADSKHAADIERLRKLVEDLGAKLNDLGKVVSHGSSISDISYGEQRRGTLPPATLDLDIRLKTALEEKADSLLEDTKALLSVCIRGLARSTTETVKDRQNGQTFLQLHGDSTSKNATPVDEDKSTAERIIARDLATMILRHKVTADRVIPASLLIGTRIKLQAPRLTRQVLKVTQEILQVVLLSWI